jgi:hypothetical protein
MNERRWKMSRKHYNLELIKEIVQCRKGQMKWREIHQRYGVSPATVLSWAKSLGVNLSRRGFSRVKETPVINPVVTGKHITEAMGRLVEEGRQDTGVLVSQATQIARTGL